MENSLSGPSWFPISVEIDIGDFGEAGPFLFQGVIIALVTVLACSVASYRFTTWLASEPPIAFAVAPPKVHDDAPILDEPSIKLSGSSAIQCYAPATGRFLGLINPATPAGIDRAIEQASAAQLKWERTTFSQRRQVLRTILAFVLKNQEEICRIACIDSGKPMIDAAMGEILTTVEKLRWTIKHGERALRPSRRPTNLLMLHKSNTVQYEPLGVVAALVSWNYPFHNLLGPVISAIFAGNGIVVKASENTAWSATYFATIARGALTVCGHNASLVQSLVCWPETAGHLTAHRGIAHITFIGSRAVGQKVAASAAGPLTPVVAELGGKDVAIVLDSAADDLPRVTETLLRGTFQSAGQNCIGIERIVACPAVYDRLVAALEPRVRALRVGSGLDAAADDETAKAGGQGAAAAAAAAAVDVGAMISAASFDRLEALVAAAVRDGARLLVGGRRVADHPRHPRGHYFRPTLLADVTREMAIAREECFAPVCVVMRAASAADAVAAAHAAGDYGLGASVFGRESWELDAVVRNLRAGMVAVNDFGAYYVVQLPFGGVGGSGYGRFGGEEGLRGLCNAKSVCRDRWVWWGRGVRTSIPPPVRYPVRDARKGWEFLVGVVQLGYGIGVGQKLKGLGKLISNS